MRPRVPQNVRCHACAAGADAPLRPEPRGHPQLKNDAVRKTDGFGNVGSHQQSRETAATPDVFNQALHLDACKRVHGTNRLIQMQQVGVVDKNASQCNPLALSTRQVCRPVIGSLGQADLSQDSSSLGDN